MLEQDIAAFTFYAGKSAATFLNFQNTRGGTFWRKVTHKKCKENFAIDSKLRNKLNYVAFRVRSEMVCLSSQCCVCCPRTRVVPHLAGSAFSLANAGRRQRAALVRGNRDYLYMNMSLAIWFPTFRETLSQSYQHCTLRCRDLAATHDRHENTGDGSRYTLGLRRGDSESKQPERILALRTAEVGLMSDNHRADVADVADDASHKLQTHKKVDCQPGTALFILKNLLNRRCCQNTGKLAFNVRPSYHSS